MKILAICLSYYEHNEVEKLLFWISDGDVRKTRGVDVSSLNIKDGNFHNLVVVVSHDLSVSFYVDGVLIAVSPMTDTLNVDALQNSQSDLQIGAWGSNSNYRLNGQIDDLKIYKAALDVSQISASCDSKGDFFLIPTANGKNSIIHL